MEVRDEGGSWEYRDVGRLMAVFQNALSDADSGTDDLRFSSLTGEATEEPEIIAARLERVAKLVHRALQRPPEHPPVRFDDARDWDELDEADWTESYNEQRRKQEWLSRAIQEQLRAGADPSTAMDRAMRDEGITGLPGEID